MKSIIIALLLSTSIVLLAQESNSGKEFLTKGKIFIGGNIGYQRVANNLTRPNDKSFRKSLNIGPDFFYMFSNKFGAGLTVNYQYSKSWSSNTWSGKNIINGIRVQAKAFYFLPMKAQNFGLLFSGGPYLNFSEGKNIGSMGVFKSTNEEKGIIISPSLYFQPKSNFMMIATFGRAFSYSETISKDLQTYNKYKSNQLTVLDISSLNVIHLSFLYAF